jgi:uncharacterized protein (TIGR02145 family)
MKNIILLPILIVYFAFPVKAQTVSDPDGNTYNTVTIGTQIWMKENLKTTRYNDGTNIPFVNGDVAWANLTKPAYCLLQNQDYTTSKYKAIYGAIYNWYTVNTDKLCPIGWHVPSDSEWTILSNFLGGDSIAGGKLKEIGITYWAGINTGADNSSGFSARPGGLCDIDGVFNDISTGGNWWTSTSFDTNTSWSRYMDFVSAKVFKYNMNYKNGLSVRCIKDDNTTSVNILENPFTKVIYPNPAVDRFSIRKEMSSNAQIWIFDLNGKQLISRRISSDQVDISSLSKGVYVVKIIDSGNIILDKLIKE